MHKTVGEFWANQTSSGKNDICSFVFEYGDNNPNIFSNAGCHASIGSNRKTITAYSSSLYRSTQVDEYAAYDFWQYILDPEQSPWRNALQGGVELIQGKDGQPVAFRLPSLEGVYTQILAGLSIGSRIPKEYPQLMRLYRLLRDNNFSPLEALYCIIYLCCDTRDMVHTHQNPGSHFPFNNYYEIGFKRLKEGNPTHNNCLYTKPILPSQKNGWLGAKGGLSYIFLKNPKQIPTNTPYGELRKFSFFEQYLTSNQKYTGVFEKLHKKQAQATPSRPFNEMIKVLSPLREQWHNEIA